MWNKSVFLYISKNLLTLKIFQKYSPNPILDTLFMLKWIISFTFFSLSYTHFFVIWKKIGTNLPWLYKVAIIN
jgi:hypothetical protein